MNRQRWPEIAKGLAAGASAEVADINNAPSGGFAGCALFLSVWRCGRNALRLLHPNGGAAREIRPGPIRSISGRQSGCSNL